METNSTLGHETTLEHALDIAKANHKQAQRLLDEAKAARAAGDIGEDRVRQLQGLLDVAA
jgi:outer membrane protein TolC